MTINELDWLKENKDILSDSDYERLNELNILPFIEKGEVHISIGDLLNALDEVAVIVNRYIDIELTQ